jgi:hypothetical protein
VIDMSHMKTWNVVNNSSGAELGQVQETSEELARCAALSKYGKEGERAALLADGQTTSLHVIYEDDDFSAIPA